MTLEIKHHKLSTIMAQYLQPLVILFLLVLPKSVLSEPKGFTLKLFIQRDPLFLTDQSSPDRIRPPVTRSRYLFTIDAAIGTPSTKRTFIFDPGSPLTWTQCTPCENCFHQSYPLFDPRKSSSYHNLPRNHPLASLFNRSSNGEYVFNLKYESGQSSSGIASIETFTFPSSKNVTQSIRGVVFGCSNRHQGAFTSNTRVTGVMGLNRSPLSLISQMGVPKSAQRFSYCLPGLSSPVKSTFLRFGNDINKERPTFKRTGFILNAGNDYRVRLLNISIGGRVLNLPQGSFSNGCMLDVGTATTRLGAGAYVAVLYTLQRYFHHYNLTRLRDVPRSESDMCYRLQPGFRYYPGMVFHIEGADLEIGPENLFRFATNRFCLALFGTGKKSTVLGAYQQQNVRFIYDIGKEKLLFDKEDCSQDKAS